jgi:phage replication-related protein YjqB (UPF0714/DUF867 family)
MTLPRSPFAELLAQDGVREECELRSTFGFMAFHGGNLEKGTDLVARLAAERAGASYYGIIQPEGLEWHIPSHEFVKGTSHTCDAFLQHCNIVVTVHGYGRAGYWTHLLLGGRNRRLARHMASHMRRHLPDYTIVDNVDAIPKKLRGLHHDNPVNVPVHAGVQLELPPRVRGNSPVWKDWSGPGLVPHTEALVESLASAAMAWTQPDISAV